MTGVGMPAGRYNPMLAVVPGDGSGREGGKNGSSSLTDEIVREGAWRMPAEALRAEGSACIAPHLGALARAGATFINGQFAERPGHCPAAEPPTGAAA